MKSVLLSQALGPRWSSCLYFSCLTIHCQYLFTPLCLARNRRAGHVKAGSSKASEYDIGWQTRCEVMLNCHNAGSTDIEKKDSDHGWYRASGGCNPNRDIQIGACRSLCNVDTLMQTASEKHLIGQKNDNSQPMWSSDPLNGGLNTRLPNLESCRSVGRHSARTGLMHSTKAISDFTSSCY